MSDAAQRSVWFEPLEVARRNPKRFMAYAFRYAIYADINLLRKTLADDDPRAALADTLADTIDARSS